MASDHVKVDEPSRRLPWLIALGLAAGVAIAALWGWREASPQEPAQPSADASHGKPLVVARPPQPAMGSGQAVQQDMNVLVAQQAEAARQLEQTPGTKQLTGPVTERPPFVSFMEWTMLQAVAKQHPQPDQELTRMVNLLRFTKQLETWESLPRSPESAPRRQRLANQLLEDLPQRVRHGDMDLKDARQTQGRLLKDAVPDEGQRQLRAATEAQRLGQALPAADRPL